MKGRALVGVCFLIAAAGAVLAAAGDGLAAGFSVPGTGACQTLVEALAEAYNRANPPEPVTVPPSSGSGGGIASVLAGEAPLARVARPLKEAEAKEGLVFVPFARDAVAFVVGKSVTVKGLTVKELADIFSGRTENWQAFGSTAGPIRVVTREPGDASLVVLQSRLPAFRNLVFSSRAKVVLYDRATVETLDKYKNSIGFVTLSALKWSDGSIRPILVEGMAPTKDNIRSGRYTLTVDYGFVYKKTLSEAGKRFLDFVFSPAGKGIIDGQGLIPLEKR